MPNSQDSFPLKECPFFVLDVACDADRRAIVSAAEDRSFLLDPELCAQAQGILLNPAKRLAAELDWFPDTDKGTAKKISEALEAGSSLPPVPNGPLSRLNRALYAFSQLPPTDRNALTAGIKELDRCFTAVDAKVLTGQLGVVRRVAGMPLPEQAEVEKELGRKRYQIRQQLARKLSRLPEVACMGLMTYLAAGCIADRGYDDGVILGDAVTEYELRVRDTMDAHADKIQAQIRECETSTGEAAVTACLQEIYKDLTPWAGLATPMNIRAQASGMPYPKGRELSHDLRELGVMLHNKKHMTALSLELITTLQRMFSANTEFREKLDKDEAALRRQLVQPVTRKEPEQPKAPESPKGPKTKTLDDPEVCHELGCSYERAGEQRDAYLTFHRGAMMGHEGCILGAARVCGAAAPRALRELVTTLEPDQPRTAEALNARGLLHKQLGMEEDLRKAWLYFQLAIEAGSREAIVNMAALRDLLDQRNGKQRSDKKKWPWTR